MRKLQLTKLLTALLLMLSCSSTIYAQTSAYYYTGGLQTYSVTTTGMLAIDIAGARGGNLLGYPSSNLGGFGGRVVCTLAVTAGQVLNIYVGGPGGSANPPSNAIGGFNGGGIGTRYYLGYVGGGGGGATDIRIGGTSLSHRVIVAGGGGGGGLNYCIYRNDGGVGGGYTGGFGLSCDTNSAYGGTQSSGGLGALLGGSNGSLGYGGDGFADGLGGGGGGGYYGGGGGAGGGGGGGSSYTDDTYVINVTHTQGYQSSHGYVLITPIECTPPAISAGASVAICNGSSTVLTATGASYYSWSPSTGLSATTGASVTANPTTTTTYRLIGTTDGCDNLATVTVTVESTPAVGPISGIGSICTGATTSLTASGTVGGVWSSSNNARATVKASGLVTGITPAPVTISYTVVNGCGSQSAIHSLVVNAAPSTISGPATVCEGTLITLTNTPGGGIWSSPDATVSVNASNGKVTGVTPGTALISYSLGSGCVATKIVTVTAGPGAPTGTLALCPGASTTLSNTSTGGTWSSSSPAKASIDAISGQVTAISSGVTYITYAVGAGCYNTVAFTVNPAPNVITGALVICPGATTDLNSTTTGGVWSSDNVAIATINNTTGLVSSVGGTGTTTISYVVGALCPRSVVVTVAATSANEGTAMICMDQPFSIGVLTNPTPGGTWSSSNVSRVPINSATGVLKGKSVGTVTITYQLGPGCISTTELTVNPAVSVITGSTALCPGATAMLGNSTTGGTWSSSNTAVATAGSASGVVTGIFGGTTTISYIINEGCYNSTNVTVYGSMSDILGADVVCAGSTTTMSSSPAGGTWSSGNTEATINMTTGLVTGVNAGTAMITYNNSSSGCYVTKQVTINSSVATISGTASICPGFDASLGNTDIGGAWSSSNASVATVNASGSVTGISSGTAIITYMTSPACFATTVQTVYAAPAPIGGSADVCQNANTTLTSGPAGGVWSSSNTANATISSTGVIRGIAPGATTIQYTLSSGCIATKDVTVNSLPDAITGTTSVCVNATTNLISAPTGGTWTSSNTVKSTIDATTGALTGKSAGTSNVTYMLPSGCYVKTTATTKAPPATITGTTTIALGGAQILYCSPGGGSWSSADPGVASYNPLYGGRTFGAGTGTTTVTYTIPSTGCFSTTEVTVTGASRPGHELTINSDQRNFRLYPNPSTGMMNIKTSVNGTFIVFTKDGRQVASYEISKANTTLSLPTNLNSGIYMCRFTGEDGSTEMTRLVFER